MTMSVAGCDRHVCCCPQPHNRRNKATRSSRRGLLLQSMSRWQSLRLLRIRSSSHVHHTKARPREAAARWPTGAQTPRLALDTSSSMWISVASFLLSRLVAGCGWNQVAYQAYSSPARLHPLLCRESASAGMAIQPQQHSLSNPLGSLHPPSASIRSDSILDSVG